MRTHHLASWKLQTEVRQLERCFEVTSSVRSRVFNGLDGAGVLIFAVFVITVSSYFYSYCMFLGVIW